MAQVRICLSCGTLWKEGTIAYIDGFCLHCPGELGPPTDAAQAISSAPHLPAPVAVTQQSGKVDLAALQAAREASQAVPADSAGATAGDLPNAKKPLYAQPVRRTTAGPTNWDSEASTTAEIDGAADDLEPGAVRSPSSALSKVTPAIKPGESGFTRAAPASAGSGSSVSINIDPLTQRPGVDFGGGSSRRHPESGSGDTTSEIILDDSARGAARPRLPELPPLPTAKSSSAPPIPPFPAPGSPFPGG